MAAGHASNVDDGWQHARSKNVIFDAILARNKFRSVSRRLVVALRFGPWLVCLLLLPLLLLRCAVYRYRCACLPPAARAALFSVFNLSFLQVVSLGKGKFKKTNMVNL